MAVAGDGFDPVFRLAMALGRMGDAMGIITPAMGAGTDPGIIAIAPIGEVVAAFLPRPGVIARFISRQSRSDGQRLRQIVEVGGMIGVGGDKAALPGQRLEPGARLDRQLVEREMIGAEGQRPTQLLFPCGGALAGQRVDEVEAHPAEMALGHLYRPRCLALVMGAAEEMQRFFLQRLHTQRHTVDPGAGKLGEAVHLHAVRVCLQRDLDFRGEPPMPPGGVQKVRDQLRRHQRGRAAAEKD